MRPRPCSSLAALVLVGVGRAAAAPIAINGSGLRPATGSPVVEDLAIGSLASGFAGRRFDSEVGFASDSAMLAEAEEGRGP